MLLWKTRFNFGDESPEAPGSSDRKSEPVELKKLALKISRSENLPVLPVAVTHVLKLADDPKTSPRQIEQVVAKDAGLMAKMLRVANSPVFGGNNITTISRAVAVLGMNNVRSLAISAAFQSVSNSRSLAQRFDRTAFWRHSLATATAARILGKMRMPECADELYTAGMIHNVGILALDRFLADEYDQVLEIAFDADTPLHEVEQSRLGYDHCEVGTVLCETWGLTGLIKAAVTYHHNPMMDAEHYETTCVIAAAETLAHQCGLRNQSPHHTAELDITLLDALELPEEQLEAIRNVVSNELARTEQTLKAA